MPTISTDKVCFVIVKAREFDAEADVVGADPDDSPSDSGSPDFPRGYAEDPTLYETTAFIEALNEDEQIDLVTLMWVGRGDYDRTEWEEARTEAIRARNEHGHTAEYLLGAPLVGDYLEEGLSQFDLTCADIELSHL